jgi:hypothetical protein
MTRFETLNGQSLGAKFAVDNGVRWFACNDELSLLQSLNKDELVVSDNSWVGTVGNLLDLFSKTPKATNDEMKKRGWGDRLCSGLSFRLSVTDTGELVLTR